MKNMKPRQVLKAFWITIAVGAAMSLIGASKESEIMLYIGIAIIIAAAGFNLLFYNCPHCGKHLDRNSPNGFCPHCGKKIEG